MIKDIFFLIFRVIIKIIIILSFFPIFNRPKILKNGKIINESLYQKDLDFSQLKTKYKLFAIYYPLDFGNEIENQPKNLIDEINISKSLIEKQVKLARNHGIFGFGVVYYYFKGQQYNNDIFNIFLNENMINFPFFIILDFEMNYNNQTNKSYLIQNSTYNKKNSHIFFNNIHNYFLSNNYYKLRGSPILGIFNSPLTSEIINDIRKYEIDNRKECVHIISISNGNVQTGYSNFSNCSIEFPSQNIGLENDLNQKYFYNYYFNNLINQKNLLKNKTQNFFIVNGSNPKKFYILFRLYLNITDNEDSSFLLFNAWNNYRGNFYLQPNKELGFSYLNYLSKAIFNLKINDPQDLIDFNNKCKIAIQIHIYYDDLIEDIVNKTNNIIIKFDLYITVPSEDINDKLKNYINKYSKANNYEIIIVENKGRDILPFLNQMKSKFKLYKYLCHIHTKKSKTAPEIGYQWRNYLYKNLLGNKRIVSEILYDFEKNKRLGFIFPETFYGIIQLFYILTEGTKKWLDFVGAKLFPNYQLGELLNFPAGNMFWAKIKAIYQIFTYDFADYFESEDNQTNDTIMHGLERIWLYLVKYNGFYYKTIFNYF